MIYNSKQTFGVFTLCFAFIYIMGFCACQLSGASSKPSVKSRDYQIDLHFDTVRVYDGKRLVGSYITKWNSPIDSIIEKDNQ